MYLIRSDVIYRVAGKEEKEFISPFAEELFQQDSKSWEYDSWKYKDNEGEAEQGMIPRGMLWGGRGKALQPTRIKARCIFGVQNRLYYVLEMRNSCGLFYYDFTTDREMRLFHKAEFHPRGLFIGEDYSILTTVENADGTVHLIALDPDGKKEELLTFGDCIDENPFQKGDTIYYQSSGIARDEQGNQIATGSTAIYALNRATGDVETLLESEKYDYLLPKMAEDGTLYCLQVPYRAQRRYGLKERLIDILLFPWRLLVALFAFLNVFSMFFAKKPLTMAGGPDMQKTDISRRILHNRVVNLQETMRKEGRKVAAPRDWKLVRFQNGTVSEIASNVLWFELDAQGVPVFTDGYTIYDSSGTKQCAFDDLISGLTLAPNPVKS